MGGVGAGTGMTWSLRRYVASQLFAVVAEWASLIGLLVHVFERSGPVATGYASIATLVPHVLLSSSTVRLTRRGRPATVRLTSLVIQAGGYGLAAAAALSDGPLALGVLGVAVAYTGVTILRPSGAVLLPALVRSSTELTTANLRASYCESASVLLGPLLATVLLATGGGGAVLAGCAALCALAASAAAFDVRGGPPGHGADPIDEATARPLGRRLLRGAASPFADVVALGRRPGARGALGAAIGQYVVLGAFDIILVVVAGEHVDLGDAGAGILTTAFGVGAVLSVVVSGRAVRRPRVAPGIVLALTVIAVGCLVFGASITTAVALVVLPVIGCSRSLVDVMARVLLQRSAPPSELSRVFGALETGSGIGLLVGSLLAQVLIATSGVRAALLAVGLLYGAMVLALLRPLRSADDGADVPVVAMSILRRLPIFQPLPAPALEAVARNAEELVVGPDEVVVAQGESGDRFFAVCDGAFEVLVGGTHVRTLGRGDGFGEVALLADTARTATVRAIGGGHLLAIERVPFLIAVTGFDSSFEAAWGAVRTLTYEEPIPSPVVREERPLEAPGP